jgi:hypothetical protein
MAFEFKRRPNRDDSCNSSLTICTFGPKTEPRESEEPKQNEDPSEKDPKNTESFNIGSLITIIDRSKSPSEIGRSSSFYKYKYYDHRSYCICRCSIF